MAVVNGDMVTEWDLSDFVSRYTSKSTKYISPERQNVQLPDDPLSKSSSPVVGTDALQTSPYGMSTRITVSDDTFCTRDNLDSRLRFLNQELLALGFPTIFPKSVIANRERDAKFDLTKLVNCTYELLKLQQQHIRTRDDLEAKHMRSESDNDFLLQSQSRLKQELEQAKREISVLQLRGKQMAKKHTALQLELRNEREEAKKLRNEVAHKLSQFQHQTKRKEKEMTKLKERMHQLLTDKNSEKRIGIDLHNVLNSLHVSDGKRRTWNSKDKVLSWLDQSRKTTGFNGMVMTLKESREVEKMYLHAITDHEERHKELISENSSLRQCLAEIQNDFFRLLNEELLEEDDEDDYLEKKRKRLANEVPFHLIKEELQNEFRATTKLLKERLEQGSSKASSPIDDTSRSEISAEEIKVSTEEINTLKRELEHCRSIIEKQDQLLQSIQDENMLDKLQQYFKNEISFTERNNFEERQQLLKESETNLSKERKQMMEYATKLSKEKETFDRERAEFYKYCISSPVITRHRKEDAKEHTSSNPGTPVSRPKFHSSTPHFSPAPRTPVSRIRSDTSIHTPPTEDLYSFLGLKYEKSENMNEITDGSYQHHGSHENENLDRKDSIQSTVSNGSRGSSSGKRSRRVAEHVENLKRALEFQQRSNDENLPPRWAMDS